MTLAELTADERVASALERIATALEQGILEKLDAAPADPFGAHIEPVEIGDAPQKPIAPQGRCPVHQTDWKLVPAGVSKKTGNAYQAFWACSTAGCNQRPPR